LLSRGCAGTTPPAEPGGPAVAVGEPRMRLLVPAYFFPGGPGRADWERLLESPDPASVVVIANPASGPGVAYDRAYAEVFGRARRRGLAVIGYVATRYGKRPADEVKADIDRWVRF